MLERKRRGKLPDRGCLSASGCRRASTLNLVPSLLFFLSFFLILYCTDLPTCFFSFSVSISKRNSQHQITQKSKEDQSKK